jgi:glycosyltransferase involved in cell wall biosynthesis
VEDGVTGFAVTPGDADAWRARILDVSSWDPKARRGFLRKAMARARETYCWQRVAGDVLGIYDRALADA